MSSRRSWSWARGIAVLAALAAASIPVRAAERPNIILCMADDHGWHEVGYYGHPHLKTPALDEMARHGLRFDRFYSAAPVCSPTRVSVLTGRNPNRSGAFWWNYSLRPEEITAAQILGNAGYRTGHFGKWHVGPVKAASPTNPGAMGFHRWLSHDNFFGFNPKLSRDGAPPERVVGESSEIVVEEAIRFIRESERESKPFFTVVWFGSPHGPYAAVDEDTRPFRSVDDEVLRQRFAEIVAMDRAIGRLRDFLAASGLRDNTLLWYCSDNGTPGKQVRWTELRGSKGLLYEGGIRVPAVIEWPSRVREPRVTEVPAVTSDILPTLCDILGLPLPDRPLDGISLVPLIDGKMPERPSPIAFWNYDRKAVEAGNPKPWIDAELQKGTTPTASMQSVQFANYRHPVARTESFAGAAAILGNRYKLVEPKPGAVELYDLTKDLSEKRNLAAEHPEVVSELQRKLREWQRSVELSLTGADYGK